MKKVINLDKVYLEQVALDSIHHKNDDNADRIDDKAVNLYEDIINENKLLKEEIRKLNLKIDEKTNECQDAYKMVESVSEELTKLQEKLKDLEEKYIKEQKRAHLLEVENTRNLDELKSLKKVRNELLAISNKNNATLMYKIKNYIDRLFSKKNNDIKK